MPVPHKRTLRRHAPGAAPPRAYRLVRPRGTGHALNGFSRECLARLIDFPEIVLRMKSAATVRAGRNALVIKGELPFGGRSMAVAYKRVARKNWIDALSAVFRVNGALRSWRLGHELLARGIATPRPLAVIMPHRHGTGGESFLITEWVAGAENLGEFCKTLQRRGRRRSQGLVNATASSVGSLIGRMHGQNVCQRDLRLANVLFVDHGTRVESFLIDLEGAGVRPQLSQRAKLRNLARLAANVRRNAAIGPTVRLRFLKSYLQSAGSGEADWKPIWRTIASQTSGTKRRRRR
jgi:tRNA A-37 threonylcarbamoyl transferase component Bud32